MRYKILNVNAEEITFKVNRISLPPSTKINLSPRFKRQVKTNDQNPGLKLIALSMSIKSTQDDPKPFDLYISFVGNFEVSGIDDNETHEEEETLNGWQRFIQGCGYAFIMVILAAFVYLAYRIYRKFTI